MTDHLKKIEKELLPEIEVAAIKGNMNRVIAALRASLTELVEDAKATRAALAALNDEKPKKVTTRKAAKKAPAKKTAQ